MQQTTLKYMFQSKNIQGGAKEFIFLSKSTKGHISQHHWMEHATFILIP